MLREVELVDIGIGNIGSVKRCLERLDINYRSINKDSRPKGNCPIILPGVGAFGDVVKRLESENLHQLIPQLVRAGTPYLGICVGLQILFETSEESPGASGFALLKGQVVRFRNGKVPQIGWNKIEPLGQTASPPGYVYFVNSYYAKPDDQSVISYQSHYHSPFCAAVSADNITAMQFHPEKSGEFGSQLLKTWVADVSK